eukprot:1142799-Pelagomonas_calceolata.AAC.3
MACTCLTPRTAQQEASFLLWYHSLCDGGERSAELLSQGLVSACLQVLVDSKAKTPDRTCATGAPRGASHSHSFCHL